MKLVEESECVRQIHACDMFDTSVMIVRSWLPWKTENTHTSTPRADTLLAEGNEKQTKALATSE